MFFCFYRAYRSSLVLKTSNSLFKRYSSLEHVFTQTEFTFTLYWLLPVVLCWRWCVPRASHQATYSWVTGAVWLRYILPETVVTRLSLLVCATTVCIARVRELSHFLWRCLAYRALKKDPPGIMYSVWVWVFLRRDVSLIWLLCLGSLQCSLGFWGCLVTFVRTHLISALLSLAQSVCSTLRWVNYMYVISLCTSTSHCMYIVYQPLSSCN